MSRTMMAAACALLIDMVCTSAVAASHRPAGEPAAQRWVDGLMAMRGDMRHVSRSYAERLVREAAQVVSAKGNRWVPAPILLGVAVTESDLKWWLRSGHGVRSDCGLTQINLASLRMSTRARLRLCRALRRRDGTVLSMRWTLREFRRIKARYCDARTLRRLRRYGANRRLSERDMFWRCVLSVYNQGPAWLAYARNVCRYPGGYTPGMASVARRWEARCRARNRYWLKVLCFARGVMTGRAPMRRRRGVLRRASCRRVYSMRQVARLYQWVEVLTQRSSAGTTHGARRVPWHGATRRPSTCRRTCTPI